MSASTAAKLSWSLSSNYGFHTVYSTHASIKQLRLPVNCSLHFLNVLPPSIFVDPYELVHYKSQYSFVLQGATDLELPVAAVGLYGSAILLNVSLPRAVVGETPDVNIDLPLHMRYGKLALPGSEDYHTLAVSCPVGFWVCPLSRDAIVEPFLPDMPVVFSSYFDPATTYFIPIATDGRMEAVQVPVGRLGDVCDVEIGTTMVILVAFFYILHRSHIAARRISSSVLQVKTK